MGSKGAASGTLVKFCKQMQISSRDLHSSAHLPCMPALLSDRWQVSSQAWLSFCLSAILTLLLAPTKRHQLTGAAMSMATSFRWKNQTIVMHDSVNFLVGQN